MVVSGGIIKYGILDADANKYGIIDADANKYGMDWKRLELVRTGYVLRTIPVYPRICPYVPPAHVVL